MKVGHAGAGRGMRRNWEVVKIKDELGEEEYKCPPVGVNSNK